MSTGFWIATFENERFWDPRHARVVEHVAAPDELRTFSGRLAVVELDDGTRLIMDDNLPEAAGSVTTARSWRLAGDEPPAAAPDLRSLPYEGELWLYADRDKAPVVPPEEREKMKKGWAF